MAKDIKTFEEYKEERLEAYQEKAEEKGKEFNELAAVKAIAKEFIKEFLAATDEVIEVIGDALLVLFPLKPVKESGGPRATAKHKIRMALKELITASGAATEQEVFMSSMEAGSAWGRIEMKDFIKFCVTGDPADRAWIELVNSPDEPMGTYMLKGIGADAPPEWEGYTPVDEVVEM